MLDFRGKGYFFASNRVSSNVSMSNHDCTRMVMRRYYGLILNASNITHSMMDIHTGEPLYKSDRSDNEILQKLYENIHDEIGRIASIRHSDPGQVTLIKRHLELTKRGNWFERVWNKYVVGDGDRKKLYGKEIRGYSYLEDMNPKLAALVNAYNEDNSIGHMKREDIAAKFGTHPRDIVAFRRWLKTKL